MRKQWIPGHSFGGCGLGTRLVLYCTPYHDVMPYRNAMGVNVHTAYMYMLNAQDKHTSTYVLMFPYNKTNFLSEHGAWVLCNILCN